jgi:hypothetical protein
MAKKQTVTAEETPVRQFKDFGDKTWILENDGKQIKVGSSVAKIISGESETIAITELLHGTPWRTWRLAISAADGQIYLLKTSREVK